MGYYMGMDLGQSTVRGAVLSQGVSLFFGEENFLSGDELYVEGKSEGTVAEDGLTSALITLRERAEKELRQSLLGGVLAIPATSTQRQRHSMMRAMKKAGFLKTRLIRQNSAAAIAYLVKEGKNGKIGVFDLGAGNFEFSVLELSSGTVEMLGSGGNARLGGDDLDACLANYLTTVPPLSTLKKLPSPAVLRPVLVKAAEEARILLCQQERAEITLPEMKEGKKTYKLPRLVLEQNAVFDRIGPLLRATVGPVKKALSDAGTEAGELEEVLLIGGCGKMPALEKLVEEMLGVKVRVWDNRPYSTEGAAYFAETLDGRKTTPFLLENTFYPLGMMMPGERIATLIPGNTPLPYSHVETFLPTEKRQNAMDMDIVQGEHPGEALHLAHMRVTGLSLGEVAVSFDMDENGLVSFHTVGENTSTERVIWNDGEREIRK